MSQLDLPYGSFRSCQKKDPTLYFVVCTLQLKVQNNEGIIFLGYRCPDAIPNRQRDKRMLGNIGRKAAKNACTMKQQHQGCAHNHEQPLGGAPRRSIDATSGNKRRLQNKDELELQYTAATIKEALADAGRPTVNITTRDRREHALQPGTVNMDGCKVMTSLDFDEYEMNAQADELDGYPATRSNAGNCDDQYLASMYVIVGLIQSTPHYYSFPLIYNAASQSGNGAGPNSPSCNEDQPTKKQTKSMTEVSTVNLNDERLSKDNSEGFSSWTPSSGSFNHLNYYNSTIYNIDNDNRSDGQSSDTAVRSSSSSPPSSASVDSASSASSPQCQGGDTAKEARRDGVVSIIG